ncbi:MAG: hypothetical protein JNK29_18760 [Anaerolineales bacterium]|nr:hypothetical protein [Anaerolineales bacterium]
MDAFFVLLGFLLRLGVPLGLTILIGWWLRRLDARWQAEGEAVRAKRAGQPALATPCWETRGCAPERRATCSAAAQPETPCWQVFRDPRGELRPTCLDCTVFRGAPALA